MDAEHFDALGRALAGALTRRASLAALLAGVAATLTPTSAPDADARKDRRGGKSKRRGRQNGGQPARRKRAHAEALPARCCSTSNCTPGPGKNLGKCCLQGANLSGKNLKGANLGQANVSGATLANANLQGANAGQACFVAANLTGAKINGSTNLGGAIFCRTTMPDGSENNSGCGNTTACCPECDDAAPCGAGEVCDDGQCRPCDVCPSGCPFATIQAAIDDPGTQDGDTLFICAGTYARTGTAPVADLTKSLTLIGVGSGPGGTSLNGGGVGGGTQPVVVIRSGQEVELRRLLVTGGANRGIVMNGGATLTLTAMHVSGNTSATRAGGIDASSLATLVLNAGTVVSANTGEHGGIGGVQTVVMNGDASVTGNSATDGGGGIQSRPGGTVTLNDNSSVSGNDAPFGGGIVNRAATLVLNDNASVTGNTAINGGGIANSHTATVIGEVTLNDASTVSGNTATGRGGGILNEGFETVISTVALNDDSTVTDNEAADGGGIFNDGGAVTINDDARVFDNEVNDCAGVPAVAGCG